MAERAPPVGKVSCCAPESIVGECSREDIDKTRLFSMVKMNCSFPQCDQSGFIHPECYQEIEEYLTRFIKCGTFSNTFKKESFRKFNLDYQHTREFIWKEKGMYGLIQKQLTCNCGKGYLKKDLVWPPSKFMRGKKKVGPTLSEATNQLPKLADGPGGGGKTIRYEPTVKPNFPKLECDFSEQSKSSSIPGSSFVDKKVVLKRGEVVFWDGWSGHIQNLVNVEERPSLFTADSVESNSDNIDIGCEVHYETVKKGKHFFATRLV